MKKEIILSICIPTYNRKNRVIELIREILNNKSPEYEIVVLDNASTDGTYEEIEKIKSSKLKLFKNDILISAQENGLKALTLGKGKYVMHFNDREIANHIYLDNIIEFLKKNDLSFIFFKSSNRLNSLESIFEKGIEAKKELNEFGHHPTGLTFRKDYLKKIDLNKYSSFENVNIYPYFFVIYDILEYGKTATFHTMFWKHASKEFIKNNRSGFIVDKSKIWFSPEQKYDQLYKQSKKIIEDKILKNENIRQNLLIRCFKEKMSEISYSYIYYYTHNVEECYHYGIEPTYLRFNDFIKLLLKYNTLYINFLKRNYKLNFKIYFMIFLLSFKLLFKALYREINLIIKWRRIK